MALCNLLMAAADLAFLTVSLRPCRSFTFSLRAQITPRQVNWEAGTRLRDVPGWPIPERHPGSDNAAGGPRLLRLIVKLMRRTGQVSNVRAGTGENDEAPQFLHVALAHKNPAVPQDRTAAGMLNNFSRCLVIVSVVVHRVERIKSAWKMESGDLCFSVQLDITGCITWWTFGRNVKVRIGTGPKKNGRKENTESRKAAQSEHAIVSFPNPTSGFLPPPFAGRLDRPGESIQ